MFIAHLPAGYIASRLMKTSRERSALMIGSVLPDIDMIYFYTLGQRRSHHHDYLTHLPLMFTSVLFFGIVFKRFRTIAFALFYGLFLHASLDTLCGDVKWLWPFSNRYFSLVHVDDTYGHWIQNFVFHWTFGIELVIVITAFVLFFLTRRKRNQISLRGPKK